MLKRNLYLLGFMGCGKSYWGKRLAIDLGWRFLDLDVVIEEEEGCSIPTIFETKGEAYFRRLETSCLKKITATTDSLVIALGGGTPCFGDNMEWIAKQGTSIFLDAPLSVLTERLLKDHEQRPLLAGKGKKALTEFIKTKLIDRRDFYKQASYTMSQTDNLINPIKRLMKKNTLLLLHGALGSEEQLSALKNRLTIDYDVRTLNFTGHGGKAFGMTPFSIDLFTNDVLTYLKEQNLDQVDIFGYSMGGYVALSLAKTNPERVGRIFTLATKFAWSPEIASKEVEMLNPIVIEKKVPAFATVLKKRHAPHSWKTHLAKTAEMMLALGNGAALLEGDFSIIQHPTLITVGSKDRMVGQDESEMIAKALPNGQFELLEEMRHPIEKIDLDLIEHKIKEFF